MAKNVKQIEDLEYDIADIDAANGIMLQFTKADIFFSVNLDAAAAEQLALILLDAKRDLQKLQFKLD